MKKKQMIFIVAAITVIAMLVLDIAAVKQVHDLKVLIAGGQVSINEPQPAVINETAPEVPSIFSSVSLEFAGAETVSAKDKTILCRVSVVPGEFRQDTKARIRVGKQFYDMKRKDNCFTGQFAAPLFETVNPEVILEDGETVRSEQIGTEEEAFLSEGGFWMAEKSDLKRGKDSMKVNMEFSYSEGEKSSLLKTAKIKCEADGAVIYEKQVDLENLTDDCWGFTWDDTVAASEKQDMELYLEAKEKEVFLYRYKLGDIRQKSGFDSAGAQLEIFSPDGTLLLKKKPYEEE